MKTLLIAPLLALAALGLQDSPAESKKPEVGKPAPTLRLNDHTGQIVEVGGKRENWTVVAFFPKAATPG